jgi:hypothetical protein
MHPSENYIDQIGFEYTTDAVIILPFCTLKSVRSTFRIKYDQRVIIKFLLKEKVDVHDIADRLQAQFCEHAYQLRAVQSWITEAWLGGQDLHDEIRTVRSPPDGLDAKILARLDKSLFKSVCSIAETLRIAHSTLLLHLHDSIGFRPFHLHWVPHLLMHDLGEKRKEYATWCCHFCMLPNVMTGIIKWSAMTRDFLEYITTSRVDYVERWRDHKAETWYWEQIIQVYDHVKSERFLDYRQISKWYQNQQRLFCDQCTHSSWTNDLSSRKSAASEMTCDYTPFSMPMRAIQDPVSLFIIILSILISDPGEVVHSA